ncbi:CoA pyrophosphatase [uncultured Polaribacter sp.]|uniref:NUDIX hydrolase n=1 Tax=uncultured Polaribacter sp. TaxID=174711 RepID=UPI002604562C|nr:CoA pyrophosphatase [uncultured Polaribacter sp.]
MNFKDFIQKINFFKKQQLGGLDAQFKMAPKLRLKYDADKIMANNPREAAVLVLFYPNKNDETCFLLTKRASYKGTHSAQISFPGGKSENSDLDLKQTALRETEEEVGVEASLIKIIRELTDVYIPPSNFLVTPFIGFIDQTPVLKLNNEVDIAIETKLSELLNDTSLAMVSMKTSYMDKTDVPCFKFKEHIVWGATAMMLSEIRELLK